MKKESVQCSIEKLEKILNKFPDATIEDHIFPWPNDLIDGFCSENVKLTSISLQIGPTIGDANFIACDSVDFNDERIPIFNKEQEATDWAVVLRYLKKSDSDAYDGLLRAIRRLSDFKKQKRNFYKQNHLCGDQSFEETLTNDEKIMLKELTKYENSRIDE
jgi:hypothetical protein